MFFMKITSGFHNFCLWVSLPDLIKLGVGNLNILHLNESCFVYILNNSSEWYIWAQKNIYVSKTVAALNQKSCKKFQFFDYFFISFGK